MSPEHVLCQLAGLEAKIAVSLAVRDAEVESVAMPALVEAAVWYMRGHGRPWSPEEWAGFSRAERVASVRAADIVARERAILAGAATRGGIEAAHVAEPIDGGETLAAIEARRIGALANAVGEIPLPPEMEG